MLRNLSLEMCSLTDISATAISGNINQVMNQFIIQFLFRKSKFKCFASGTGPRADKFRNHKNLTKVSTIVGTQPWMDGIVFGGTYISLSFVGVS